MTVLEENFARGNGEVVLKKRAIILVDAIASLRFNIEISSIIA